MRNAAGTPQGKGRIKPIRQGAGGYLTMGVRFANDGTCLVGGDAAGAWVRGPSASIFTLLYEASRLPTAHANSISGRSARLNAAYNDSNFGCFAGDIAPSDSSRIYMSCEGDILKSTNGGATFTKIGGPYVMPSTDGANGNRDPKHRMIIDPQNPNVMMLGPCEGKVVYWLDGTTPNVLTVAAGITIGGLPSPHYVAVDPTSSVVGGVKQKWYYSVAGTGIYESTTGPAGPYTLMSGSPTTPRCMTFDAAGNMWVIQWHGSTSYGGTGNVYKKASGSSTFTQLNTGNSTNFVAAYEWQSIAINPQNTNQIVLIHEDGALAQSTDGAATWMNNGKWDKGQIGVFPTSFRWQAPGGFNLSFSPAEIRFHPTSGKLYVAAGQGLYYSTPPTGTNNWPWYEDSKGIEMIVVSHILCPPGGKPLVGCLDVGIWPITDEVGWNNVSVGVNPDPSKRFGHAWTLDYAPEDPNFIITNYYWSYDNNGYSTDGGLTWTLFTGKHPAVPGTQPIGGQIVCKSKTEFFWFPSNNIRPAQSLDGGATWTYMTIGSTPTSGDMGWGWSLWAPQHAICVDKTNGDVYAFNYGSAANGLTETWSGLYKRSAATGTWSRVKVGGIASSGSQSVVSQLIAVPGNTGHLLFIGGDDHQIWKSTNGGVSFSALASTNASAIACGKAAPGKTYPTIYFAGSYNGNNGLWRSVDGGASFQLHSEVLNGWPGDFLFLHGVMAASQDVFGDVYFDNHNAGLAKAEYNGLASLT